MHMPKVQEGLGFATVKRSEKNLPVLEPLFHLQTTCLLSYFMGSVDFTCAWKPGRLSWHGKRSGTLRRKSDRATPA